MSFQIHVVLPTHQRPELLKRTLLSLADCKKPDNLGQVLVVENGARSDIETFVKSLEDKLNIAYLYVARANKSHALNCALETIRDGLIYFIDDDIRLHPDVLVEYAQAAEGVHGGQFFGGPMGVDYEVAPPEWLKEFMPPSEVGWTPDSSEHRLPMGCNWAAFASDLKKVGGFTEKVGPGTIATGQETDMQLRLKRVELEMVYVPSAKVWHYVSKEHLRLSWLINRSYRNGVDFGRRYWTFDEGRKWFGYPLWVWKGLIQHELSYVTASIQGSKARFKARYKLAQYRGKMKGANTAFANGLSEIPD